MRTRRTQSIWFAALLLGITACSEKTPLNSYQLVHRSSDAEAAIKSGTPFDVYVVWPAELDPTSALKRFAEPLIDAQPEWGQYMGISVGDVNGQDHTVTLHIEMTRWDNEDALFEYCRSVQIPADAIFLLASARSNDPTTYNELKQALLTSPADD